MPSFSATVDKLIDRTAEPARAALSVRLWAGLFVIGLASTGLQQAAGHAIGYSGQEIVHALIGMANLLLIASAAFYVAHLRYDAVAVGRTATLLAALGALGCAVALSIHWIETYFLALPGHPAASTMYELIGLFSLATVVLYLVMERVYRTRAAGAFVMPIVTGAILFEIWLDANQFAFEGVGMPTLRAYWMYAHILFNFLGYGAFALAAAAAAMFLVRTRAPGSGSVARRLPEASASARLLHLSILIGFPLFSVATLLGMLWAGEAWGRYWAWDPKETWALAVWLLYGAYFRLRALPSWSGRRIAWWTLAAFAATAFGFLGVDLLWPGLHAGGGSP